MSFVQTYLAQQERLVLSILPRFVALEMIADMSCLEDELSPQEFHKIYIHQYKDVRFVHTPDISRHTPDSRYYNSRIASLFFSLISSLQHPVCGH